MNLSKITIQVKQNNIWNYVYLPVLVSMQLLNIPVDEQKTLKILFKNTRFSVKK